MPSSIVVSISERDILKIVLEFLENHNFHISQLSLERETGVINGNYSEDLLFLRQLILDGQWDNAIDFIGPLKEIPDFDSRSFRYFIIKYKYYELLCIKQEPGPMYDNDFAVEEIVECLKELENLCVSADEFRRLCALLTLKKLSDHEDLKIWNPSSARVECFYKVLPLVSDLLHAGTLKKSIDVDNAVNDRLVQLITKGMLYEAAVDYCQSQALEGKNASAPPHKLTDILLPKQKLSSADLSLVSWLEVLGNEQFTIPFQQKALEFKLENYKKPPLEAQWAEQILAAPIRPAGHFPHALVPNAKLKCAEKMCHSMVVLPRLTTSMVAQPFALASNNNGFAPMLSRSTTAALGGGFSIGVPTLSDEATMRQSQIIDGMLEGNTPLDSAIPVRHTIASSSGVSISNSMNSASDDSIPTDSGYDNNDRMSASSYHRRELDAICRRNQSVPPSSFAARGISTGRAGSSLPVVPELPTPVIAASNIAEQFAALTMANETDGEANGHSEANPLQNCHINPMVNSRLFQEFKNNADFYSQHRYQETPFQNSFMGMKYDVSAMATRATPPIQYPTPQQQFRQLFSPPNNNNDSARSLPNADGVLPVNWNGNMVRPNSAQIPLPQTRPQSYSGPMAPATSLIAGMNVHPMYYSSYAGGEPNRAVIPPRPAQLDIRQAVSAHQPTNNTFNANKQAQSAAPPAGNDDTICARMPSVNEENLPVQFVPLCRYEDSQAIRAVAFHPSGHFFAIGTNSKQMHICKYPDIRRITSNPNNIQKPQNPEILFSRPKQHRGSVYCCAFSRSGELLATGSNDKTLRLMGFNADECKIGAEMELTMHDGTVRELVFMNDPSSLSGILVSGGAGNCHICVTDCTNGRTFKSFVGHTGPILGLYSWGATTSFASCSQDKTIRFWDLRASSAVNVISPDMSTSNSPVTSVCVDPSGKLLVSGHEDASILLYDIVGGRVVQLFRPHGDEVRTVRCSNAAYYLLSGSYDKRVVITDIRGDLTAPLMYLPVAEHADKVIQCRWHPQDFTFLSTSADRTAILWSLPQLD